MPDLSDRKDIQQLVAELCPDCLLYTSVGDRARQGWMTHHVSDVQIFDGDQIRAINQRRRLLMQPCGTSVDDLLMHSRDLNLSLAVPA